MNIKTILSNWRDIVVSLLVFCAVIFLMAVLANPFVRENELLSTVVSGLLQIAMGGLKMVFACAFAWFALAMTLPEANKTIVESAFDHWWREQPINRKCLIGLITVAVLFLGACICLAS